MSTESVVMPQGPPTLSAAPLPEIASLTFKPDQITPGQTVTGTVTLKAVATADVTISLTTDQGQATVGLPAAVTVLQGQSSASFTFKVAGTNANVPITQTATLPSSPGVSATVVGDTCNKGPINNTVAVASYGIAFIVLLALLWIVSHFAFSERKDYSPLFWLSPQKQYQFQAARVWVFLTSMGIVSALMAIAGAVVSRRADGILIDEQNRISLSRFQAVVWSIIVLGGFATAALSNVYTPWKGAVYTLAKGYKYRAVYDPKPSKWVAVVPPESTPPPPLSITDVPVPDQPSAKSGESLEPVDGLDVGIPTALYLVMGISATTLVAAGVVTQGRKGADSALPTGNPAESAGLAQGTVKPVGDVVVKPTICDASWRDLFQGTTPDDFAHVDLNRLQNLFFTIVMATGYAAALCMSFGNTNGPIHAFPNLDNGALTIFGISHAAYLVGKATGGSSNANPPGQA